MTRSALSTRGEEAWSRLKRSLEWTEGFALVFVFTAQPQVVAEFRDRLADIHRARVTGLRQLEASSPPDLLEGILPRLLAPTVAEQAPAAPRWLDLSSAQGAEWEGAILAFLMRLNEQRELLRRASPWALVVVLPTALRERIRALVPDLWSIRDLVVDTEFEDLSILASEPAPEPLPAVERSPFPLSPDGEAAVSEWGRVGGKDRPDRGLLLSAGRAFDALYLAGRLSEASEVAARALTLARQLAMESETPEALRDVSISLDNVGMTAKALGRWDEARAVYGEALAIGVVLARSSPDLPDYAGLESHFRDRLSSLPDTSGPTTAER